MAWLSVGTSNDDLVEKMQMFGVLRNDDPRHHRLIDAFLNTDRGDFVPQEQR
jgi:protein-L-isoaspartate O-methyltransferase